MVFFLEFFYVVNSIVGFLYIEQSIQDIKMEVETITKSQREKALDIENLIKKSGAVDLNINNRIQGIEERISDAEDTIKCID